ncbi:MAG: hypothetical protein U0Q16_34680 [Bryobacteraceae bacterium]
MSQITIYLDGETEKKVRKRAKAQGISVSKWIARAIEAQERDEWPASVLEAFGTWDDVPDIETIRAGYGKNAPRESLD